MSTEFTKPYEATGELPAICAEPGCSRIALPPSGKCAAHIGINPETPAPMTKHPDELCVHHIPHRIACPWCENHKLRQEIEGMREHCNRLASALRHLINKVDIDLTEPRRVVLEHE